MKLETRIEQLETAMAAESQKRQALLTETCVLRAAIIGLAAINAASAADRHGAALSRAKDRLASYLFLLELPETEATEAIATLEDMFYEIDAAQNAADQTPPRLS